MGILGTDIQIDFSSNDIMFDSNSDFKTIADEENLKQAIKSRLITKLGDLKSQSLYGSNLYLLTGNQLTDQTKNVANSYIYESLQYEPRIKSIDNLTVDVVYINGKNVLAINLVVTSIANDVQTNIVLNYNI